jgi:DNA repair exonuclease SbcCD nuclease subunit
MRWQRTTRESNLRVLFITDRHHGARSDSGIFSRYFEKFYADVVLPYIDEYKITTVIDLGDQFDRRKYINFQTLADAKRMWFQPLHDRNIDLHMIVGNHDTFFKNTNALNSPTLLLAEYPKIHVYASPETVTFDNTDIAMLPWICPDNYLESMEFIKTTPAQVLLGHLEIQGFPMYMGSSVDHGFDPSIFDRFELVCSGHYHHRSASGNIRYLGAPYEMSWSDFNDPKGFHVFDTDNRTLTFVENPYRMFHKLYYHDGKQTIDQLLATDFQQYRGTYVRVVVQQKSNAYNFKRYTDALEEVGLVDLSFSDDTLDLSFQDQELEDVEDTRELIADSIRQSIPLAQQASVEQFILGLYADAVSTTTI